MRVKDLKRSRDGLRKHLARRPDIGGIGKIPHHRVQPLVHVLRDAVEQEGRRPAASAHGPAARAAGRGRTGSGAAVWVRSHGGWYAGRRPGNRLWHIARVACALERRRRGASLAHGRRSLTIPFHLQPSARRAGACRGAWSHAARLALDIALPTLCVACREPVDGEGVCAKCWAKLSFIAPPYCPRLGIPFVYDPGPELLSMEAIANPPAYARARAAVRYDDVARTLVHALKYQDRTDLAPAMGRWMARAGRELLDEADVLVPVPLHWRRGWSRRYNQSGALARVIERQSGVKAGVRSAAAGPADPAADRPVAVAARQQCAGRVQGRGRPAGRDRRAAAWS